MFSTPKLFAVAKNTLNAATRVNSEGKRRSYPRYVTWNWFGWRRGRRYRGGAIHIWRISIKCVVVLAIVMVTVQRLSAIRDRLVHFDKVEMHKNDRFSLIIMRLKTFGGRDPWTL